MHQDNDAEQLRPEGFDEALDAYRVTFRLCRERGIGEDSILSAVLTEILPRLVSAYGAERVEGLFLQLAQEITRELPPAITH